MVSALPMLPAIKKRNTLLCAKHGVNDPREITIPDVFSCSLIIAYETYNPDELSRVKED